LHLSFTSSKRLMRIFGAIVGAQSLLSQISLFAELAVFPAPWRGGGGLFSAASFALASALAAVRAARSEYHAAVIYCVNRPNGSASTFVSGL
jgi:hypothetical protein